MARKVQIDVVVDPALAERGFKQTAASARVFNRELQGSVRGVISASGAFNHLGRSLAFASGGFIAFASAGDFIRDSIGAARDAAKAQRSLAAQLKANGESFAQNKAIVEKAALSYGRFGFENDEVIKSLTILDRGSGKITRALKLQQVTVDLARAKNISLAAAANVVAKVFGRQETALRRAVPGLSKNAHGLDLIREASRKLAGQGAANTDEAEKFNAILHNTKEIIGTALLPTLNRYLESLGKWLDKMNRTGELQRDVNKAVKDAQGIFAAVKSIVEPLADAFKGLGDAVGGTANEVKLLAAAFAAFKFSSVIGGIAGIGGAATTSTAEVKGLRGALLGLKGIGAIALTIDLILNKKQIDDFLKSHHLGFATRSGASLLQEGFQKATGTFTDPKNGLGSQGPTGVDPLVAAIAKHGGLGFAPAASSGGSGRGRGFGIPSFPTNFKAPSAPLSARQQFELSLAANPNSISLLKQQADHDRAAIAFAGRLRARGTILNKKYVAEVTGYQADLQQTLNAIAGITAEAARKAQDARDKAKAARERARALQQGFTDAKQGFFSGLGVGRTAETLKHLRFTGLPNFQTPAGVQLAQAKAEATGDTSLLVSTAKLARAAARRAIRSGTLSIQAQIDAWNVIRSANDQLSRNLSSFGPTGRVASSAALTSGIRFASVAARRKEEARLAQALAHGVTVKPIVIHNHTYLDGKEVARSTTKHQTVSSRHRAVQTSGIHAGRVLP